MRREKPLCVIQVQVLFGELGGVPSPALPSGVACACFGVTLVLEPDAGNPHVRFDERMWETPDRCGWWSMRASTLSRGASGQRPCSTLLTVRRESARTRVPREAYLVIRASLARLVRKTGRVGWTTVRGPKFEVFGTSNPELRTLDRACRARLACLAHDSRARAAASAIAPEAFVNHAG